MGQSDTDIGSAQCSSHRATLYATRPLAAGEEIVVDSSPFPDTDTHTWPLEVTFDGGARSIGDMPKMACAGATVWQRDPRGGPPRLLASVLDERLVCASVATRLQTARADARRFHNTCGCKQSTHLHIDHSMWTAMPCTFKLFMW